MSSDTAYNISHKSHSDIREEIAGKRWLHLLKDGIDNVPEDFVKSFFNIPRKNEINWDKIKKYLKTDIENKEIRFEYYQQIIIDTINEQICNKEYLPIIFYINPPKDSNEDKKIHQKKILRLINITIYCPCICKTLRNPTFVLY